jgi:hypothetical protein
MCYISMLKFFALDARLVGVGAASTGRTLASALAAAIVGGPLGQRPPSWHTDPDP